MPATVEWGFQQRFYYVLYFCFVNILGRDGKMICTVVFDRHLCCVFVKTQGRNYSGNFVSGDVCTLSRSTKTDTMRAVVWHNQKTITKNSQFSNFEFSKERASFRSLKSKISSRQIKSAIRDVKGTFGWKFFKIFFSV